MSEIRIVRMNETCVTAAELADLFNGTFGEYEGVVPATTETMAWYLRRPGLGTEHAFLALVGKELVGSAFVTATQVLFGGKTTSCGIVDSVMTRPDWRRQGIATALMKEALRAMQDEGLATSLLYAVEGGAGYRIYSRLGYQARAAAYYYHSDAAPDVPTVPQLRPAQPDEEEIIRQRLNEWLGHTDGYVPLDEALWRWRRQQRPGEMPCRVFVLDGPKGLSGTGTLCMAREMVSGSLRDLAVATDIAANDVATQEQILYGLIQQVPEGFGFGLLTGSLDPVLPAIAERLGLQRSQELAMVRPLNPVGEAVLSHPPCGWYTLGESLIGI